MDCITCFRPAESLIMDHISCWCMPKEDGRPTERKTRVEEDLSNSSFKGQTIDIFWNSILVVNSSKKQPKVRQDVEALKEMPMPCCMCEPMVTAQSLGDETHHSGQESTDSTLGEVFVSVGCKPGRLVCVRTRTRANAKVRPQPPCERAQATIPNDRKRKTRHVKKSSSPHLPVVSSWPQMCNIPSGPKES